MSCNYTSNEDGLVQSNGISIRPDKIRWDPAVQKDGCCITNYINLCKDTYSDSDRGVDDHFQLHAVLLDLNLQEF